ncbi:UNVERIFIED_ORG: RecA-family ATPase [Rhizobium esperanzae]
MDGGPPGKVAYLEGIRASSFAGREIPARRFVDGFNFFPAGELSYLSGPGGGGKTTVALQLAAAVARPVESCVQSHWLGAPVGVRGPVLFISCEDDEFECQRRLEAAAAAEAYDLRELRDLRIFDMSARLDKALLVSPQRHRLVKTPIFDALEEQIAQIRPALVIIDNRAQAIICDEIDRSLATRASNIFGHLGKLYDSAIVILTHPSLGGMANKSGSSGSTAWTNTGRATVYLRRPDDADDEGNGGGIDDGRRVLVSQKSNYSPTGRHVNLKWDCGVYRCTDLPPRPDADIGQQSKSERVFLKLMGVFEKRQIDVSANPNSPGTYAPNLFFKDAREGLPKRALEDAMKSLIDKGTIEVVITAKGTTREKRLLKRTGGGDGAHS